jgi:hypothetical protein
LVPLAGRTPCHHSASLRAPRASRLNGISVSLPAISRPQKPIQADDELAYTSLDSSFGESISSQKILHALRFLL